MLKACALYILALPGIFERLGGHLGASWERLGGVLGRLGDFLGRVGASCRLLGPSWSVLETS